MTWLKNNGITLLIIIFLGFLVYRSLIPRSDGIDPGIQKKLDSVNSKIAELSTENRILLKENNEIEKEKQEIISVIQDRLKQIQPKYVKTLTDFKQASPDQKKKFVSNEFERRKKEMNNELDGIKNK